MQITGSMSDQLMVTSAHRYNLGRSSYAPNVCMRWIRAHWTQFQEETQRVMVRDTFEWLVQNNEDHAYFVEWLLLVNWMYDRLDARGREQLARDGFPPAVLRVSPEPNSVHAIRTFTRHSGGRLPPSRNPLSSSEPSDGQ
jgi:hypothetical protein